MVNHIKDYQLNIRIHMFWIKRKCPIEEEIKAFAQSRKHFMTTKKQTDHLRTFVKLTGIQKYDDITETDIESYLMSVKNTISRESERLEMAQALFMFIRFKRLERKKNEKRKRGRPEDGERNDHIMNMYHKDYTLQEIANEFHKNKKTIHRIVKRRLDGRENHISF